MASSYQLHWDNSWTLMVLVHFYTPPFMMNFSNINSSPKSHKILKPPQPDSAQMTSLIFIPHSAYITSIHSILKTSQFSHRNISHLTMDPYKAVSFSLCCHIWYLGQSVPCKMTVLDNKRYENRESDGHNSKS